MESNVKYFLPLQILQFFGPAALKKKFIPSSTYSQDFKCLLFYFERLLQRIFYYY